MCERRGHTGNNVTFLCEMFLVLPSGFSVSKRRRKRGKIGFSHRILKEESMKWFQQKVCAKNRRH